MSRPGRYHRLSIAAKQQVALEAMREPPVTCPRCGAHTGVTDLLGHLERCQGQSEPHPRSRWITSAQVQEMGVPSQTLSFWAGRGVVRFRGERLDRQYLMRDVVLRLADRRASMQPRDPSALGIRRKGWFRR